jgi:hypothetical protein
MPKAFKSGGRSRVRRTTAGAKGYAVTVLPIPDKNLLGHTVGYADPPPPKPLLPTWEEALELLKEPRCPSSNE